MDAGHCECCGCPFPEGEGQLGDICQSCNWEVDILDEEEYSEANHMTLNQWLGRYLSGI